MAKQQTRLMSVEIVADGRTFPSTRVEEVFARNQIVFEPREIAQSDEVTVKYHTWLDPRMSLDDLSAQLMRDGTAIDSPWPGSIPSAYDAPNGVARSAMTQS